jgi:hypothetical protein
MSNYIIFYGPTFVLKKTQKPDGTMNVEAFLVDDEKIPFISISYHNSKGCADIIFAEEDGNEISFINVPQGLFEKV